MFLCLLVWLGVLTVASEHLFGSVMLPTYHLVVVLYNYHDWGICRATHPLYII